MSIPPINRQILIGIIGSLFLLLLPVQNWMELEITLIEAIAVVTSAWSVWLLSKNNPLGWWIGLVGVLAYTWVFYQVRLYGEVAIQLFYLVTSLQAIYSWLRGGENHTEKPIARIPPRWIPWLVGILTVSVIGLRSLLIAMNGSAPFWDALTTVASAIAQLLLMQRYVESWYLWIGVDTIYVPLYASRGLYLTSFLYAIFWLLAIGGLQNFKRLYSEQKQEKTEP
ncbi:nicotinamide riboside transporter PnuC [Laspinema sp. A4]|uniref:nicotinamide riboside transporter PnuC n=1 Tax=Laspinema sp. D2d TaxID=2953686 RepID=UPI0021BB70CB|nr:nicotinamide riboside transporter PnuC [Laspinema sp. D2d]MCT7985508.1 nicotinamide riboside transporter PnuC [Laspinema sp. D2d]